MRRLAFGLAALLMGCSAPPPVINITVVMPPAQAPVKPEPVKTSWHDEPEVQGDWPQWGWRVIVGGILTGTPFEFIEQCYGRAKSEQEKYAGQNIVAGCHWMEIPAPEQVHEHRV
jgi:hypothetical protein